jgi:hypothetical protein
MEDRIQLRSQHAEQFLTHRAIQILAMLPEDPELAHTSSILSSCSRISAGTRKDA